LENLIAESVHKRRSEGLLMRTAQLDQVRVAEAEAGQPNWVTNTSVLWEHRRTLLRVVAIALLVNAVLVFLIPKRYESTARIMPPETSGASTALFAALAGRGMGELSGLSSLAGSLLGTRTSSALFVDLLRSSTISGDLIDRFQLQSIYRKRYRVDTAKYLARHTTIVDDKKSGVISITVEDSDPQRARDLAQAYLDELNQLVNKTNTSSAHQERVFIERRLAGVQADLERAQQDMSDFSSTHTTIDIREQTRATVDAAAKLQAQVIVEQSELDSLQQIYGDGNVRVRAARARMAELQHELNKMSGSSAPLQADGTSVSTAPSTANRADELYPSLRQLPRLAVPYADIYRRVRVQEAVYEMLTQQYEVARIQEAKEIPVVRVIDAPGIPEKKSFPPRAIFILLLTLFVVVVASAQILIRHHWDQVSATDPRKALGERIALDLHNLFDRVAQHRGAMQ
jgi:capsule polysaccharide export protein KpsE/RkpR